MFTDARCSPKCRSSQPRNEDRSRASKDWLIADQKTLRSLRDKLASYQPFGVHLIGDFGLRGSH
jgi:hypothetical protein